MAGKHHFIQNITQKDGAYLLHCYTQDQNFEYISEILCVGKTIEKCAFEKKDLSEIGYSYIVKLPTGIYSPCKFFIVLNNKKKVRVWKPWKTLRTTDIPNCFYFSYDYFNLMYNPHAEEIIHRKTNGIHTVKPMLTGLAFREKLICFSGYLFVPLDNIPEKITFHIVKFREEGTEFSFDVAVRVVKDQAKIRQAQKWNYTEFWHQEILEFQCIVDPVVMRSETGFFKLFIKYKEHFADIKNFNEKLIEGDRTYRVCLPFFRKALFVPYYDDIVNTWRLDVYRFNLLERVKLRQLFKSYSQKIPFKKDPNIWLIGEYPNTARDNGLHFFKYLRAKHPRINAYYVINSDSPDRDNLGGDNVIYYGSYKHFAVAAKAKTLVFSHAANFLVPKIDKIVSYKNKYQSYKTIFLQHGVIAMKTSVSIYKKKLRQYDRFVVSSNSEKKIINEHLGYDEKEIIVTGLARWDNLLSLSTRGTDILIMPTWRNNLNNVSEERFVESDFYRFWSALLSNDKFLALIRRKHITVKFFLHFALYRFVECFEFPEEIKRVDDDNIQYLLGTCGLMVTDYSSAAFDVLIQNKPVIYAPFDYDKVIGRGKGHSFIDFEKDLPGPVSSDVETTIFNIEKHVENGYSIEPEYRQRNKIFFDNIDGHNCDRIYSEITKLLSL